MRYLFILPLLVLITPFSTFSENNFESDTIKSSEGDIVITFIGHGTLHILFRGISIHIDPYGKLADYSLLPDADMILITHQHRDHLDKDAIDKIRKSNTDFVVSEKVFTELGTGTVMKNGDSETVRGINIEAVPAYNIVHKRDNGIPYHPKGEGNGYILTLGDKRIYIAGDTENIPEMKQLKNIDIAFIPMNLPYTMDPDMASDAAKTIKAKIIYPYHYGETDPMLLVEKLKGLSGTEVRVRKMR